MKTDKLTWEDVQAILLIDEGIMLDRFSRTGRLRAFSQRHCKAVLREFSKKRGGYDKGKAFTH